jgi:diguanylate cyclase (GGDEF)-like protein
VEDFRKHLAASPEDLAICERLRFLSTHDLLTGLYNRSFFEAALERLQQGRQFPVNIMVVDVNEMKTTNDTFGHAAGNELLQRTAQVLRPAFCKEDIIARIGGDEFVVLFTGPLDEGEAVRRVRECLEEHNLWSEGPRLSLAIGVASGTRTQQLVDVLKKADQQMYREKVRSRGEKLD